MYQFFTYLGNIFRLYTPETYGYDYMMMVTPRMYIDFQVAACNDAHVALSTSATNLNSSTYEIVIGGGSNTKCFIRTATLRATRQRATTPDILKVICFMPKSYIKGAHTIYFSGSFFNINQKPVILRTDIHSKHHMCSTFFSVKIGNAFAYFVVSCLLAKWRYYLI